MKSEQLQINTYQQSIIAENLRHLMSLKKTTESKVAQALNIPVMTIKRILSGETTDPRISTLKTIADYFNVTLDTLTDTGVLAPNESISQSKPIFIPLIEWELAKKLNEINLKDWHSWIPLTTAKTENINHNTFALESKPSMYPRFQQGTIFILDPDLTPVDGDLVLINLRKNNELTLRELFIDPPESQLHSLQPCSPILKFSKENHQVLGVVFMTLFYNRKIRSLHAEV